MSPDPLVLVTTDPVSLDDDVAALAKASGRSVELVRFLRDRDARGGWRAIPDEAALAAALERRDRRRGVPERAVRKARRGVAKLPPRVLRRVRRYAPDLPLGPLPGERGPGITPGSLLGARLSATDLAPERPVGLVVAADRQAAAGVWFVVRARPDLTAVFTVEAALRYLALAQRRAPGDLDWRRVLQGDEAMRTVVGLPADATTDPCVLVVADGSVRDRVDALLGTARAEDVPVVVLDPAAASGPFLRLDASTLRVRPDHADAATTARYLGEVGPDVVVLPAGGVATSGLASTVVVPADAAGPGGEPVEHALAAAVAGARAARGAGAAPPARRLLVGPANYAGQGDAWAGAVRAHLDGVEASNLQVAKAAAAFGFPADLPVSAEEWAEPAVRAGVAARALLPATHVLVESLRPLAALERGDRGVDGWDFTTGFADLTAIAASGRTAGVLLHGSETRRPAPHAQRYAWSPFGRSENATQTARLVKATDTVHALLARWDGPVFVSTLDLLDDLPGATWLPVVVGPDLFRPAPPPLQRARPVVVHAPSSPLLKGTGFVEPVLSRLDEEGVIDYRPLAVVPAAFVGDLLREADVVVDQVVLGNPGVLAAQAMAAGRVVVAHLAEHVRERFPLPVPVVEATPADLEDVLRAVCTDRERHAAQAATGVAFARELHDGRRAAAVLAGLLGLPAPDIARFPSL